jgi:hypothetical protein
VAEWSIARHARSPGGRKLVPMREKNAFVEDDGSESMGEDFSNNIEHFLFNSHTLKQKTPNVYEWIGKNFGDTFKVIKDSGK